MPLSNNVRRVVTTVDAGGKAVVLFDGDNPHTIKRPDRPTTSRLLWVTSEAPAASVGSATYEGAADARTVQSGGQNRAHGPVTLRCARQCGHTSCPGRSCAAPHLDR